MQIEKGRDGITIEQGYVDFKEITEPANPSANTARLCCKDNGSGKTQWGILFPSGSFIEIAVEA